MKALLRRNKIGGVGKLILRLAFLARASPLATQGMLLAKFAMLIKPLFYQSLLLAKALPEWDLRYFSKSYAFSFEVKAM